MPPAARPPATAACRWPTAGSKAPPVASARASATPALSSRTALTLTGSPTPASVRTPRWRAQSASRPPRRGRTNRMRSGPSGGTGSRCRRAPRAGSPRRCPSRSLARWGRRSRSLPSGGPRLPRGPGERLLDGVDEVLPARGRAADHVDIGALALHDLPRQRGDRRRRIEGARPRQPRRGDPATLDADRDLHLAEGVARNPGPAPVAVVAGRCRWPQPGPDGPLLAGRQAQGLLVAGRSGPGRGPPERVDGRDRR